MIILIMMNNPLSDIVSNNYDAELFFYLIDLSKDTYIKLFDLRLHKIYVLYFIFYHIGSIITNAISLLILLITLLFIT
jgi:hypothetical protein